MKTLRIYSLSNFRTHSPWVPSSLLLSLYCFCIVSTLFFDLMFQLILRLDKDECTLVDVFERFQIGGREIQTLEFCFRICLLYFFIFLDFVLNQYHLFMSHLTYMIRPVNLTYTFRTLS